MDISVAGDVITNERTQVTVYGFRFRLGFSLTLNYQNRAELDEDITLTYPLTLNP